MPPWGSFSYDPSRSQYKSWCRRSSHHRRVVSSLSIVLVSSRVRRCSAFTVFVSSVLTLRKTYCELRSHGSHSKSERPGHVLAFVVRRVVEATLCILSFACDCFVLFMFVQLS